MSVPPDLPIGSELLGYRIEEVLGRGGMGIVYLAEDLRLKRRVALKLLSPELAEDERFRERLLAESELAASLDHPNIVPIYEAGEVDGRIFISMRYVEGKDLKELLREGPLAPEQALALVSQVAGALDAAHARGLVHRDVKPSNVLIAPEAGHEGADHAYLADFGLTTRLSEGAREPADGQRQLLGTVEYVAPEQIRGEEVDGRADLYSLGCLMYECLAGKPPFPQASDAEVLFAHLQAEPPTLPGLEQVLPKALAKSPDDRYQTGREFVDAARSALGLARPRRVGVRLVALAGAAVLVAAVLLAVLLTRGSGSSPAAVPGRLVRIDPGANTVTKTLEVGRDPTGIAVGAGRVWMTTAPDSSVWRVDPKTFEIERFPVNGGTPVGVAVEGGAVSGQTVGSGNDGVAFVAADGGVTLIDANSGLGPGGRQTGGITALGSNAIANGAAGTWAVASDAAYRLASVAFGVGKQEARVPIPQALPSDEEHVLSQESGVAVGERDVWVVGDEVDRRLWRIDPRAGRIRATKKLPFAPGGVAAGLGGVWVTAQLDDEVIRIDPRTNQIVATIPVGRAPWGIAVGAGAVWVANTIDGTVSRIDPRTNRVVATIRVGANPKQLAVGAGSVWVAAFAS